MDNQQVNDILFEDVSIDMMKTKNLQDEIKILNIINDVHEDYAMLYKKYGLTRDAAKRFKNKLYNQYEKIAPSGFYPVGDGMYCVNGNGVVIRSRTREYVKLNPNKKGYLGFDSNKHCNSRVHKLVAEVFLYNPDPKNNTQVNHKDGNKQNNNMFNLEWCTPKENVLHAYENGLISRDNMSKSALGSKNSQAKITEEDVKWIRSHSHLTKEELAKKFNVSISTIYGILSRKNWNHI